MTRPRGASVASQDTMHQELGSMYDYLAKVILLGPSGTGKSCLLHRFVKNEWRVLTSQTIGVEFATKIIRVGTGARRKRIKLQLWDTAGTERFRSVSRSYYRGAAGAVLVYDIASHASFRALQPFLNDARALASPGLCLLLVGNKADLGDAPPPLIDIAPSSFVPSSYASSGWTGSDSAHTDDDETASTASQETVTAARQTRWSRGGRSTHGISPQDGISLQDGTFLHDGRASTQGGTAECREVTAAEASRWAAAAKIPVAVETSAFSGDGVDALFTRLAAMILAKIELGEVDPDDPASGIQYGDATFMPVGVEAGAVRADVRDARIDTRRRKNLGLREWEEVFVLPSRRRCCG